MTYILSYMQNLKLAEVVCINSTYVYVEYQPTLNIQHLGNLRKTYQTSQEKGGKS